MLIGGSSFDSWISYRPWSLKELTKTLNTLGHSQFSETYFDYLKLPANMIMSRLKYLQKLQKNREN